MKYVFRSHPRMLAVVLIMAWSTLMWGQTTAAFADTYTGQGFVGPSQFALICGPNLFSTDPRSSAFISGKV